MKKLLPIMVLLGLIAVSCNKTVVPDEPQAGSYTFVLNASVDQDLTKTDYTNDVTFSWSDDDAISVLFHKGEDHKFFTLTTSEGGSATAKFTGEIESGYELGASEAEGGVAWALFPASSEHSWDAERHLPDFYEAPEIDYTQSHFSANLPMYANGDAEGNFTFKYLTSCYKFTFTNIEASKVKFMVHSSGSGAWYLSGKSPIKLDGETPYLQCYDGTGSRDVTYIEAVESKKAVFYVPFRGWEPFTPEITLVDADNNATLLHATAKEPLASAPFGRIVVLPAKSIGEAPVVPPAAINIDGDMSDWADIKGAETPDAICKVMKVFNDDTNFYVYLASAPGGRGSQLWGDAAGYYYLDFDWDNDETTGIAENKNPGFDCWCYLYIFGGTADAPIIKLNPNGHGEEMSIKNITAKGVITDSLIEIELSIPRADMVPVDAGTTTRILSWRSKDGSKITQTYTVK